MAEWSKAVDLSSDSPKGLKYALFVKVTNSLLSKEARVRTTFPPTIFLLYRSTCMKYILLQLIFFASKDDGLAKRINIDLLIA